jgi:hypothetical protein
VPSSEGRASASDIGYVAERLVEAYAVAGSGWRLGSFRPGVDADHKDMVVDERGGFRSLYVQVKSATHPDREGRVVAFADYPEAAVPESPRLVYVVGLLSVATIELARIWVVPSADFNRLAYRQHKAREPGRVVLQFSSRLDGDSVWDRFVVGRLELGPRLLELVRASPADASLDRDAGLTMYERRG